MPCYVLYLFFFVSLCFSGLLLEGSHDFYKDLLGFEMGLCKVLSGCYRGLRN